MIEMNAMIANNILTLLKKTGTKQNDLAAALDISKQTMSKMLGGSRAINAVELMQIATFFKVKMEDLTRLPDTPATVGNNAVRAFMGSFESAAARQALEIADELADMIIFHAQVRHNAEEMMQPWKD